MKKQLGMILVAVVFLIGFSIVANAQQQRCRGRSINGREARQQQRILSGVEDGQLTNREASRLEAGEQRIERQEDRFRETGGGLSPQERARLESELNRESQAIYRQRHDSQRRYLP
jgi:hypothetical protein